MPDPGVDRPVAGTGDGTQNIQSGVTRVGPLGDDVADQNGGYLRRLLVVAKPGDDCLLLGGLCGNVDPAPVLVACDMGSDGAGGDRRAGYGVVRRDRSVDVAGDDEQERAWSHLERHLDARGVKQAEGGIQRFAEVSVVIVVDVAGMQDDADPELAVRATRMQKAGVVAGKELTENRDDEVDEERLIGGVDQRQQAIATVSEPVAAARADSR